MNIFLSIKVAVWVQCSYDNYGVNNPYDMKDEYFSRLTERQKDKGVVKERNIYIPVTIWYGIGAKTWYYLYYKSYYENDDTCFKSSGIIMVDLKLKSGIFLLYNWQGVLISPGTSLILKMFPAPFYPTISFINPTILSTPLVPADFSIALM
jgi:hypothetical protein